MKQTTTMKHPDPKVESYGFNLSQATTLRCVQNSGPTVCGECEACSLKVQFVLVQKWLPRAGDQTKRRFMLGLVRRLHSVDLLEYLLRLLQPLSCKDFTYARARTKPSLGTDGATMASDRAMDIREVEAIMAETWYWFQGAKYWTKSNFLLGVLQHCNSHMLHQIAQQAQTLLAPEKKAFIEHDDYEASSIASSTYTHRSEDHPELDLLTATRSEYSTITSNPFRDPSGADQTDHPSGTSVLEDKDYFSHEIVNDDSGSEDETESDLSSVDPTCMVIPASTKAYSGVAKHKDFIRSLPVHLSKYTLSYLDTVSLNNCVCVSPHWRILVDELHKEYTVAQDLWDEVMLMQGSAAQGCNPVYAKDVDIAVPNLKANSWEAIRTDNGQIRTQFKSEVNFTTAYSGYSTRNIIMEERNVYCGAYNVMVLINCADPARFVHTDGSHLVATGSTDRKVRFVDTETALPVEPLITGHAGSVRCVVLDHKNGYVLSGSYDTSIRKWSLETGKCQKILRGHRDTVQCMSLLAGRGWLASGAKDNMCKVWDLETGKCIRTFKHRHPITAVALSDDLCISGCEGGKVKVWDMKTGQLIKRLSGHHAAVSAICFDKWHIVTAGRDGYALVWSAQGNHARNLTALRHPKEVLCLEFMFLRAITGSADGKLRIWNILTGKCLRIMRGNSRSDPITELVAIGNRLTINTSNNTLVLNFEPIEYDYTLENDKMPSLVQYSKYCDAPVRPQPYSYIRAQRMKKAGATNTKLIYHDGNDQATVFLKNLRKPSQTPHSAKMLNNKTMSNARQIQSAGARMQTAVSTRSYSRAESRARKVPESDSSRQDARPNAAGIRSAKSVSISGNSPPRGAPSIGHTKSKFAQSTHSGTSVVGFKIGRGDDDSDICSENFGDRQRRVSWAFQHPSIPKTKELGLSETKALLRSQIRARGAVIPPDFIYLTVNTIQTSMKQKDGFRNIELGLYEQTPPAKVPGRPSSSPSRIDPRTRIPVEDLDLHQLMMEADIAPRDVDTMSVAKSAISGASSSRASRGTKPPVPYIPKTAKIITEFSPKTVEAKPQMSLHGNRVKSSIPKPRLLRPHTASLVQKADPATGQDPRPQSAAVGPKGPASGGSPFPVSLAINAAMGPVEVPGKDPIPPTVKSSARDTNMVPMLMYPTDMHQRLELVKQRRIQQQNRIVVPTQGTGRVSEYNGPMRDHIEFKLYTHEQEGKDLREISRNFEIARKKEVIDKAKKQRAAWLAKVTGKTKKDFSKKTRALAPELGEFASLESVAY